MTTLLDRMVGIHDQPLTAEQERDLAYYYDHIANAQVRMECEAAWAFAAARFFNPADDE